MLIREDTHIIGGWRRRDGGQMLQVPQQLLPYLIEGIYWVVV